MTAIYSSFCMRVQHVTRIVSDAFPTATGYDRVLLLCSPIGRRIPYRAASVAATSTDDNDAELHVELLNGCTCMSWPSTRLLLITSNHTPL